MPLSTILDRVGDAVNPIVIKELRQAVQSRFVVGLLCVFLLAQLVFIGIYLVVQSISGNLYAVDFRAGRDVFTILHAVLLATCVLCIPTYCGFRLAAERSEVHVDLFYISTLRPRTIVAGKLAAALMLAVLIFSACTPFMTFTYYLRGIDMGEIFFVIGWDFLAVIMTTMIALFLAVVPANRVLKVLLALVAFFTGMFACFTVVSFMVSPAGDTLAAVMDDPDFWLFNLTTVLEVVGMVVLLFTGSVALLSPLSANRILPLRLGVTLFCVLTLPAFVACALVSESESEMLEWLIAVGVLAIIGLLIAVGERESWAPRVARSIPRRWWLRPIPLLFFSGAAGGVIWAMLLGLGCLLLLPALALFWPDAPAGLVGGYAQATAAIMAILLAYFYVYALTAVLLRNTVLKVHPVHTWIVTLALMALGSGVPYMVTLLVQFRSWNFWDIYPWLLTDLIAGAIVIGKDPLDTGLITLAFVGTWAVVITVLNARWFIRQMLRFRPYSVGTTASGELLRPILSATPMDVTRTAP